MKKELKGANIQALIDYINSTPMDVRLDWRDAFWVDDRDYSWP